MQETRGWDEGRAATFPQRVKEGEQDYRYFPEPDLPPLVIEPELLEKEKACLPELPPARLRRFQQQYGLGKYDASILTNEPAVADYFEQCVQVDPQVSPKVIANWLTGDLFGLLNETGQSIEQIPIGPPALVDLVRMVVTGQINQNTGKIVLAEMYDSGAQAETIVEQRGLRQVSNEADISFWVQQVLDENPAQVASYLAGKETVARWLFGQVMRQAQGKANPQVVQQELDRRLRALKRFDAG
jgi:aspartyl-tRNA(Asn)/glutamyl-tRNA(Gln) amidotransferase subunit B